MKTPWEPRGTRGKGRRPLVNTRLLLGFIGGIGLAVEAPGELARGLKEGFTSLFARRYLPVKEVGIDGDEVLAALHWRPGTGSG